MKSVTQKRNAEVILAIGFQTVFLRLTNPKLYFEDQTFAISGQNQKNKFRNNHLFRNNLWSQKFLPLKWTSYLQICLNTRKNTKLSVGIKYGKDLLTSCALDSLASMIECR